MNKKFLDFIRNFSYTLLSNLISLLASILVVLVVPKLIGIKEYSYWQLYIFYSSYVGFMHFGWNDGIYLRYGGKEYKELDKQLFFSQFLMLVFSQFIFALLIFGFSNVFISDINRLFILEVIAFLLVIVNTRFMLLYILQGTNRIKEYAQITIMDRIIYIFLIIFLLAIDVKDYKLMIFVDLVGKFISLLYAMYCCKEMVFHRISTFYFSFKETINNISVGIKLMFANIASMLIIGIVRFGIERAWSIATFGKVSLALSISNLFSVFINAVGIVLFPLLKRSNDKQLPSIYVLMRNLLMMVLLGGLIVYYPLENFLSIWLPQYLEALNYMVLIFPIIVFEGQMNLLVNTYLKVLRKEKLMLRINIISVIFSLLVTLLSTKVFLNLNFAVITIVVLLAFRCILAEIYLSKILKISIYKDVILELIVTSTFILIGWFMHSWFTAIIYGVVYLMYLFVKRKDISITILNIKLLIKKKNEVIES